VGFWARSGSWRINTGYSGSRESRRLAYTISLTLVALCFTVFLLVRDLDPRLVRRSGVFAQIIPVFDESVQTDRGRVHTGYLIARNCKYLDEIARRAGLVTISSFGLSGSGKRGRGKWSLAADGVVTVRFLMESLSRDMSPMNDPQATKAELQSLLEQLEEANQSGGKFRLDLRVNSPYMFDKRRAVLGMRTISKSYVWTSLALLAIMLIVAGGIGPLSMSFVFTSYLFLNSRTARLAQYDVDLTVVVLCLFVPMSILVGAMLWKHRHHRDRNKRYSSRDFPYVTGGVNKTSCPYPPGAVHRAIQESNSACGEFGAPGIHVFHSEGEDKARPGIPACHGRGGNKFVGLAYL